MRSRRTVRHLLALTMLALASPRADGAGLYTFTDLWNLYPVAINAQGQVVGTQSSVNGGYGHLSSFSSVYVYSAYGPQAGHVGLIPGGAESVAGINSRGQVLATNYYVNVGTYVADADGHTTTVLPVWRTESTGNILANVGSAINDRGQVAGWAELPGGGSYAYLESGGKVTDLGNGTPTGINASGQIVGISAFGLNSTAGHAFLYSGGSKTDLGTLGGQVSDATAINASGQVVGWSHTPALTSGDGPFPPSHAFLYSNGKMADMGTLGGDSSRAWAINDSGQIVGESQTYHDPRYHAFIYSHGVMHDLNALLPAGLGWTLVSATGINDAGQIIGTALDPYGNAQGFLLTPEGMAVPATPIPEPGTLAVFGLAAAGLAARRLRRRAA